jgi:hypothetical protein
MEDSEVTVVSMKKVTERREAASFIIRWGMSNNYPGVLVNLY